MTAQERNMHAERARMVELMRERLLTLRCSDITTAVEDDLISVIETLLALYSDLLKRGL